MKRVANTLVVVFVLSMFLSACLPVAQATIHPLSEAQIKTAVAGTLTVERALAAGEILSIIETPGEDAQTTPEANGTPETDETQAADESQEPQPTLANPWMLQSWCEEHMSRCVYYDVQNRTDSWLQIELKERDTGVTGFFTIKSKTTNKITLIPGQYSVKYTWWCGTKVGSLTVTKSIGSWIDVFKCPQGYYQRLDKK